MFVSVPMGGGRDSWVDSSAGNCEGGVEVYKNVVPCRVPPTPFPLLLPSLSPLGHSLCRLLFLPRPTVETRNPRQF